MSPTLRDFIAARESEVKSTIKALNDELRELRAAKSAIDAGPEALTIKSSSRRMTHRGMIVDVLKGIPNGCASDRLIELVREKFEVEIPQASMSSQLSRAKSDGVLVLDHTLKTWRLASSESTISAGANAKLPGYEAESASTTSSMPAPPQQNSVSTETDKAKAEDATNIPGFLNPKPSLPGT